MITSKWLAKGWIIWATFLSLYPFKTSGSPILGMDKLVHFLIYFIMFLLINRWKPVYKVFNFSFCVLYGLMMELAQHYFITGRYFELWDLIANISGVFVGLVISNFIIFKT
jgi:VanZ family protein